MDNAHTLREKVERLNRELEATKRDLERAEKGCSHTWTQAYTPIHHEGYTIPGDDGRLGIDSRGDCYVPPSTTEMWTRTCTKCGRVDKTQHSKSETKVTKHPCW